MSMSIVWMNIRQILRLLTSMDKIGKKTPTKLLTKVSLRKFRFRHVRIDVRSIPQKFKPVLVMPRCHCIGITFNFPRLAKPRFYLWASEQLWYDGVDCIYRPVIDAIVADDSLHSICIGRSYFLSAVAIVSFGNFLYRDCCRRILRIQISFFWQLR